MVPDPAMERSDPPSPKRQKTEEETTCYDGRPTSAPTKRCNCSTMSWIGPAGVMKSTSRNFDTVLVGDHLIWMISHCLATLKPTDTLSLISWRTWLSPSTTKKELGFVIFLWNKLGIGQDFDCQLSSILWNDILHSFQINDTSDNLTKPFRAVVRYFPGDIEVVSCNPKESC
ncbi:hypothetical protein F2Q70_00014065 [Brassica cretica]|uniref:Uncharacterized protein n=1 Tax=Brassica cretica TaxID=69181 RepID=A0A8S9HZR1_BRACR|nr:hypothetical protein F2Q70_00014065 [Brassica cretica]